MANKKKVIDSLCHLTSTGDEVDRCYASSALGTLGDNLAIPALIQRLRDEDIDVSIDAVEALGRIGNPEAIPALLESLTNDPNGEVKTAIVEALGKIGGEEVIAPLLEIAKSCPDDMDDTQDWNDWWDMQLKAVETLGRLRVNQAVPVLAAILEDEEGQDIESEVLKALALIGGETVLIKRLTEGSPRERRRAAIALGFSHGARKALARAMTDKVGEVRVAAIRALGKQGASQYLDVMLRFLKDPDAEMRRAVIEVTRHFSVTEPEKIAALLTDSSPAVRAAALSALRDIDSLPQEILEQIRSCLNDPDDTVVAAACSLLSHLGDQTIRQKLLQILSDRERDVSLRSIVATALGILGDSEALNILSWAVKDEAQPVRFAALNALMQLHQVYQGAPQQRTPLDVVIAALKGEVVMLSKHEEAKTMPSNENESVSDEAPAMSTLEAIAMDNAEAAKLLMDEEKLPPDEFSEEIQEYIEISQENIELGERLFVQKKVDVATDVRHLSARILGESDHIEAIRALIEALNDDDTVLRREAAESLGHIAKRSPDTKELADAVGSLATHLNIGDRDLRLACARTLGLLANKSAIPILFSALPDEDSSVRRQIIQSLTVLILAERQQIVRRRASRKAFPRGAWEREIIAQFVELLHDRDVGVCKAAAEALAALGHTEALDSIIEAAFVGAGATARDMGRALRLLDIEQSSDKLLKMLDSLADSSHRRFVIEMLEEIFRLDQHQAKSVC